MRSTWRYPASRRPSSRMAARIALSSTMTIFRFWSICLMGECTDATRNPVAFHKHDAPWRRRRSSPSTLDARAVPDAAAGAGSSGAANCSRDGRVDKEVVLLQLRLRPVLFVEIFDGTFAHQGARQDHHPDETAGPVEGRLREDGVGSALEPGSARAVRRRAAMGVDADAALEEAADAGALMPVPVGAAAGREPDAVAAQQEIAGRQSGERRRQLLTRHGGTGCRAVRRIAGRELEAPAGGAIRPGRE